MCWSWCSKRFYYQTSNKFLCSSIYQIARHRFHFKFLVIENVYKENVVHARILCSCYHYLLCTIIAFAMPIFYPAAAPSLYVCYTLQSNKTTNNNYELNPNERVCTVFGASYLLMQIHTHGNMYKYKYSYIVKTKQTFSE